MYIIQLFSICDFNSNKNDGHGVDWPIRYADISPWYDYVETFVGVSGQKEGLKQVPDGVFLPPFELNCAEQHFREEVGKVYPERVVTPGRVAHLTEYKPEIHKGFRGQCQTRNKCWRGCPFGAYFSSITSTIPVAEETGTDTPDWRANAQSYLLRKIGANIFALCGNRQDAMPSDPCSSR